MREHGILSRHLLHLITQPSGALLAFRDDALLILSVITETAYTISLAGLEDPVLHRDIWSDSVCLNAGFALCWRSRPCMASSASNHLNRAISMCISMIVAASADKGITSGGACNICISEGTWSFLGTTSNHQVVTTYTCEDVWLMFEVRTPDGDMLLQFGPNLRQVWRRQTHCTTHVLWKCKMGTCTLSSATRVTISALSAESTAIISAVTETCMFIHHYVVYNMVNNSTEALKSQGEPTRSMVVRKV